MPVTRLTPLLLLLLLAGCDQLGALLELPDPQKEAATIEAEGKAIGGACRHSGRALEDCYAMNPKAQKAAVFSGWREMNDYMMQNNMQTVPSRLGQSPQTPPHLLAVGRRRRRHGRLKSSRKRHVHAPTPCRSVKERQRAGTLPSVGRGLSSAATQHCGSPT